MCASVRVFKAATDCDKRCRQILSQRFHSIPMPPSDRPILLHAAMHISALQSRWWVIALRPLEIEKRENWIKMRKCTKCKWNAYALACAHTLARICFAWKNEWNEWKKNSTMCIDGWKGASCLIVIVVVTLMHEERGSSCTCYPSPSAHTSVSISRSIFSVLIVLSRTPSVVLCAHSNRIMRFSSLALAPFFCTFFKVLDSVE